MGTEQVATAYVMVAMAVLVTCMELSVLHHLGLDVDCHGTSLNHLRGNVGKRDDHSIALTW